MSAARPSSASTRRDLSGVSRVVGFTALIGVTMYASVHLAPPGSHVASWWPAAGLSVASLLLTKDRARTVMVLMLPLVSFTANLVGGRELPTAAGFALANTTEALAVFWWLNRRSQGVFRLKSLEDMGALALAALIGSACAGTVAGLTIWLGVGDSFVIGARTVMASHAAALLVVLPLFADVTPGARRSVIEHVAQAASILVVLGAVFAPGQQLPLVFVTFPPLLWAALRFGVRFASIQVLIVGLGVTVLTRLGGGPFFALIDSGLGPETVTAVVQSYIVTAALMLLPLAIAIQQRREMSAQLATSEARLRGGFEGAFTGMLLLSRESSGFRVVEANNLAASIMRSMTTDLTGAVWCDWLHEEDVATVRAAVAELLVAPGSGWRGDVRLRGDPRTRLEVALSLAEGNAKPPLFSAQIVDVTAQREAQEALARALEREQEAVRSLEALDQEKTDFLSSVSHELRTPITSVIGYTELLISMSEEDRDQPKREMLERIERNGNRLLAQIEDLLSMAQVGAGNLVVDFEQLDLCGIASAAMDVVELHAETKGLHLELSLPQRAVLVNGDRDHLERAAINLLNNAVKFTDSGSVRLRLETHGDHATLSVIDSGCGIPAEELGRLFDRFFRASSAKQRAIQGTGIGLSLVRNIAKAHGGDIRVRSTVGMGTCFELSLPMMANDSSKQLDSSRRARDPLGAQA